MPEISFGELQPSSIASGYGSVKSFLNNGLQVGAEPITPVIMLDLISLSAEITYIFDSDVIIQFIGLGASVAFTLKVERSDGSLMTNTVTSTTVVSTLIPVVAKEKLKLSAASSLNVRLILVKSYVENKI